MSAYASILCDHMQELMKEAQLVMAAGTTKAVDLEKEESAARFLVVSEVLKSDSAVMLLSPLVSIEL